MATLLDILWRSWLVLIEMAPYLLLGFALAGVMRVFLPQAWIKKHLGGKGLGSVVKSALLGVPLPLCSCGVMPLASSIQKSGASRGATASFLIATPQTGVDSIAATWALLGWPMAVARAVIALITGIVAGFAAELPRDRRLPNSHTESSSCCSSQSTKQPAVSSCCSTNASEPQADTSKASCCSNEGASLASLSVLNSPPPPVPTKQSSMNEAFRFAAITLPRDIAIPLLLGVIVAGLLTAILTPDLVAPYLNGWWAIPLMAVIGLPVYMCSTGVIPLALALIALGATPGTALTLMIAGPAANAATWSIAAQSIGRRAATVSLLAAALCVILTGYLVDLTGVGPWLISGVTKEITHGHGIGLIENLMAVALIVLLSQRWWPAINRLLKPVPQAPAASGITSTPPAATNAPARSTS